MKSPNLSFDEISAKIKNLPPRVKMILIFLIALFLLWFFLGKDISRINQLKKQKFSLQLKLSQEATRYLNAKKELGKSKIYKKQIKQIDARLSTIKGKLMNRKEIPEVLSYLTSGMEENIGFSLIKFEQIKKEALYDKLPVTIELDCDFLVFLEYLDRMKNTLPLLEIENLDIKRMEKIPGRVNIVLQASAFISK